MDKQLWPCGFWEFGIGLVFVANGPSRLLSFILFFYAIVSESAYSRQNYGIQKKKIGVIFNLTLGIES